MFKVYITQNKLIDFFIDESDAQLHSDWFKVLRAQEQVGLDNYDEGAEDDMNNPLFIIRQSNPQLHFTQYDAINEISNGDYAQVLELNPCGAYILDVTPEIAKKIQVDYGVICESTSSKLDATLLTTADFPVDRAKNGRTWERFPFGSKVPSNSLIIQDRFFCKSDYGEKIDDTFENYEKIIRNLLPNHFSGVYHLMVIFDGTKIQSRDRVSFNDIAKQFNYLKEQIEHERGYSILLEVLSVPEHSYKYDKTHNRRILSNYYWIRTDHKLKAFRGTDNLATQSLVSKFLYASESILIPKGSIFEDDSPDMAEMNHKEWIEDFKQIMLATPFSGQYSQYNKNKKFPPIVYDYSVNGVSLSHPQIQNRLFSQPIHLN